MQQTLHVNASFSHREAPTRHGEQLFHLVRAT
jgi:hypothetical protein